MRNTRIRATEPRRVMNKPRFTWASRLKRFFGWCFFLFFLAGLVVGSVAYRRADGELRNVVQKTLQNQFPNLEVSFESVSLDPSQGVRLRSVEWRRSHSPHNAPPILTAEEVFVAHPIELRALLANNIRPTKIVVRRPRFYARETLADFIDDVKRLRPEKSETASSCPIEIIDASLALLTPSNVADDATIVSGFRATLTPVYETDSQDSTELASDLQSKSGENEQSTINNRDVAGKGELSSENKKELDESSVPLKAPDWQIEASASNHFVESLEITAAVTKDEWKVSNKVKSLDVASLLQRAPDSFLEKISEIKDIQGKTTFDFEIVGSTSMFDAPTYKIEGELFNGAITTPILKYPLSNIEASYSITNESAELKKMIANCGLSTIKAAYRQKGALTEPKAAAFRVQLESFPLDDSLLKTLASSPRTNIGLEKEQLDSFLNLLNDYRFAASTNIDLKAEKTNATNNSWKLTDLLISSASVDLLCRAFPYKLERLAGRVALNQNETLSIDLHSDANVRPVSIVGSFANIFKAPKGSVDIEAKNLPIDSKFLQATPARCQSALNELRASGELDAKLRVTYDKDLDPEDPLKVEAGLVARDCAIQYDNFPLPISSISGSIFMREGAWVFSDFHGVSGAATLIANGSLTTRQAIERLSLETKKALNNSSNGAVFDSNSPAPIKLFGSIPIPNEPLENNAWRFVLTTNFTDFPLGKELSDALVKYENKKDFDDLRAEGKANGQARVAYRADLKKFDVEFDATLDPETAAARPIAYPFDLKNIEGRVVYRNKTLTLEGFRGRCGRMTFSTNLTSRVLPNDGWIMDFSSLRIDQVEINRDLQSAASNKTLALLDFLKPSGCFNIDGALRISKNGPNELQRIAWDLRLVAQQNAIHPIAQIDALCGKVRTFGVVVGGEAPLIYGELNIDSLYYKDLMLSQFSGPFYYNGSDFFWGREAPPIQRAPIYQDAFIKEHIDSDSFYASEPKISRAPDAQETTQIVRSQAPGFDDGTSQNIHSSSNLLDQQNNSLNGITSNASSLPVQSSNTMALKTTEDRRRPLRARTLGGELITDGAILSRVPINYRLNATLQNASLSETFQFFAPKAKPTQGRADVDLTLRGEGATLASLKGVGNLKIRDAKLYELPQIVKIFQMLSVQEPDQAAFNSADAQFEVLGDRLKLSNVQLVGNAMSLVGSGWLTIGKEERIIDLTLNPRLGNSSTQIPIASDVIGGVGDQIAQIRVEGNVASPVIQRESFPGVKKAWWSVFPEQEPAPTDKAPVEKNRPLRDAWRKLTGTDSQN